VRYEVARRVSESRIEAMLDDPDELVRELVHTRLSSPHPWETE